MTMNYRWLLLVGMLATACGTSSTPVFVGADVDVVGAFLLDADASAATDVSAKPDVDSGCGVVTCGDGICASPCEASSDCPQDCAAAIAVDPTVLTWSGMAAGAKQSQNLMIHNEGTEPLIIKSILFTADGPGLTLDAIGGLTNVATSQNAVMLPVPVTVATFGTQVIALTALGVTVQAVTGTLTLYSNDPLATNGKSVPLHVYSDVACPTAKFVIAEGDVVVPQTTLHFNSTASVGSSGTAITKWLWTVTQPPGVAQTFSPSAWTANPKFVVDVTGEYEFCLNVVDTKQLQSCAQACQTVQVVPSDAVHIELLWDTPGAPTPTALGGATGADLDLHFANYLASNPDVDCDGTGDPWFNNPFDCFWFNPSPQWGSANPTIQDDPTLSEDATAGPGPEILDLQTPEGMPDLPRWYAIGAHVNNDHGFGVSNATITVSLFGAVALKIEKILMNSLNMWYVGKLNWPNQLTGTSTPPLTICYQTPGSKPGDVCAGNAKMWQPKGEWCITPNYKIP